MNLERGTVRDDYKKTTMNNVSLTHTHATTRPVDVQRLARISTGVSLVFCARSWVHLV